MQDGVRRTAWRLATVAIAATLLIAGCGLLEESPPVATPTPAISNILIDPGFETSDPPAWRSLNNSPLVSSTELARSGERSAALASDGADSVAVQTVSVSEMPEFLSGYYRVEEWPDSADAYLQFTVRAAGAGVEPVRALRFLIAGAAEEPEPPAPEVRFVFLSRDRPVVGEWTYFAYPVREAFVTRALAVPTGFSAIDITVEARSSGGGGEPITAYFDDLYLGPQAGNPNRPRETRE